MMIRIQPIIFTPHIDQWSDLLSGLGLTCRTREDNWVVFTADGGRIALHASNDSRLELWFESAEAREHAETLEAAGGELKKMDLGEGITVWEVHFDGVTTGLSEPAPGDDVVPTDGTRLSVLPLWYTANMQRAVDALTNIGLTPRISSDGGGWADFTADDGLAAVHTAGREETALAFEYTGDLNALQAKLASAGIDSRVIDEAFGSTLRVDHPDGGEEIWINAVQDDLYGYYAHEA